MEVVVYDENINNINTYFNDYIIDHNQDISFRVYNKKLDVLYKDIAHNKIIGIFFNLDNGIEKVLNIIKRILRLNAYIGIAFFSHDDKNLELENIIKDFKSNYQGCVNFSSNADGFNKLIAKMKERYQRFINNTGIRFKLFQNFEMYYNGKIVNFKSKLAKELMYKLVSLKGTSISKDDMYCHLYPYESVELFKTDNEELRLKLDNRLRQNWFQLKNTLKEYGLENIILRGNDSMRLVINNIMTCPEWNLDDLFSNGLHTLDFSEYDLEDEHRINNDCIDVLKESPYFQDFYSKKHNS